MPKKTRIQKIKNFIKILVASVLVIMFIVLTFFIKHNHSFENSNMKKWDSLTDIQRMTTIQQVIPDFEQDDLFIACMNKIAKLPESNNMIIQSAISLCYNGIKLNDISVEQ